MSFSSAFWGKLPLVECCVNAVQIGTKRHHVTFYSRAASSIGWTEAYRHATGVYAMVCIRGWQVALSWNGLAERPDHVTYWYHKFGSWSHHRAKVRAPLRSRILVAALRWAFAQPGVAQAMASEVEDSSAFCRLMRDAANDVIEDRVLDERTVENMIESALDDFEKNFEVHAEDVKGIEDAVREQLRDSDLRDELAEEVVELMARKLGR